MSETKAIGNNTVEDGAIVGNKLHSFPRLRHGLRSLRRGAVELGDIVGTGMLIAYETAMTALMYNIPTWVRESNPNGSVFNAASGFEALTVGFAAAPLVSVAVGKLYRGGFEPSVDAGIKAGFTSWVAAVIDTGIGAGAYYEIINPLPNPGLKVAVWGLLAGAAIVTNAIAAATIKGVA